MEIVHKKRVANFPALWSKNARCFDGTDIGVRYFVTESKRSQKASNGCLVTEIYLVQYQVIHTATSWITIWCIA